MLNSTDITGPVISPSSEWEQQTWAQPQLWDEVNATVDYLLDHHRNAWQHLCHGAECINGLLQLINPLLDQLCRQTCTFCPDPCCMEAKIWYDIKDLLFLHLCLQPCPPGQPLALNRRFCSYLGTRGCSLPRRMRPWICTYYLCPAQKGRLRRFAPARLAFFEAVAEQIKIHRQGLLTAFERVQSVDFLSRV